MIKMAQKRLCGLFQGDLKDMHDFGKNAIKAVGGQLIMGKEEQKQTQTKTVANTQNFGIKSMKVRIMILVAAVAVIATLFSTLTLMSGVKTHLLDLNKNYMYDLAFSYGKLLNNSVSSMGENILDMPTIIGQTVGDASVEGMDSSYTYVVSHDGTMLYHPTADKIGQPVENEAVKSLVSEIKGGTIPVTQVIRYEFNGAAKYAAAYTSSTGFILVVTADESDMLADYNQLVTRALAIAAIVIILGIIAAFVFANMMTKPLLQLVKCVQRIAILDFTDDMELKKLSKAGDETGAIARAVRSMKKQLIEAIVNIREQSKKLYTASTVLDQHTTETSTNVGSVETAVNEIATGASSQASETQRATEDIVTMGTMIEDTNDQVTTLNKTATLMKDSSQVATEALQELDAINKKAIESIDVIYEQTNTTNASALKIKDATSLIASIAEETNLLSLNASIEAARAGEAGRGFAVVASQIQKLAEQSNNSAKTIDEIIAVLLKDSETAVHTMEDVKEIMKQQNENVEKTGTVFTQVREGIDESISGMSQIVSRTSQLDNARTSIVDTVQNLTAIAQENAASTQETTASVTEISSIIQEIASNAAELQNIAEVLEENMSKFKTE